MTLLVCLSLVGSVSVSLSAEDDGDTNQVPDPTTEVVEPIVSDEQEKTSVEEETEVESEREVEEVEETIESTEVSQQPVAVSNALSVPSIQEVSGIETTSSNQENGVVTNETELLAAIAKGGTVTLGGPIVLTSSLRLNVANVTIDLNNQELSGSTDYKRQDGYVDNLINVEADNVTIKNGTLKTNGEWRSVVSVAGNAPKFTLENVTLDHSSAYAGAPLVMNGNQGSKNVTVTNCKLILGTSSWYAINADSTSDAITLTVTGTTVEDENNKGFIEGESASNLNVSVDGNPVYALQDTKDGNTYSIGTPNVSITSEGNTTYYATLEQAIADASANSTVDVLADVTISSPIEMNKSLTINGNDHSVTATYEGGSGNKSIFTVSGTGNTLTLSKVNLADSPKYGVQVYGDAAAILTDVTITNPGFAGVLLNGGKGTLNNVTVNSQDKPAVELGKGENVSTYPSLTNGSTVSGGTGLYVDSEQINPETDEYKELLSVLESVAQKNDMSLSNKDGVIVADEATQNTLVNPATKVLVTEGWNGFLVKDEVETGPVSGGYNTLEFDQRNGGFVTYAYTNSIDEKGTAVSVKVYLDPNEYSEGDLFNLSVGLDNASKSRTCEYPIVTQYTNGQFVIDQQPVINEAGVYTYTWSFTKDVQGLTVLFTVANESGEELFRSYRIDDYADDDPNAAESIRYVWAFGRGADSSSYSLDAPLYLCTDKVPVVEPVKEENKTTNLVSTWDNGGPFTTDSCGSVYDRWGNLIWQGTCTVNGQTTGFQLVNTADR